MRQGKLAAFTRRLGVYKFLPLFFLLGAGIELFMIKVRVGRETFCKYPSRTKSQVVGFLELIDQKIFARVIDQTWTVKKAGYRLGFFYYVLRDRDEVKVRKIAKGTKQY